MCILTRKRYILLIGWARYKEFAAFRVSTRGLNILEDKLALRMKHRPFERSVFIARLNSKYSHYSRTLEWSAHLSDLPDSLISNSEVSDANFSLIFKAEDIYAGC